MPVPVKCVWIFNDRTGTGWQEVHYWLSSGDTPDLGARLTAVVDNIGVKRAALLSGDCSLVGGRVSYDRPGAVASLSRKVFLSGPQDLTGVNSALSLACKFADTTKTRHKITHLRGFWDAVEYNGEYHPEGGADQNWQGRFNDWKTALISGGYGWPSKDIANSARGQVTNYVVANTGHVTFTLAGSGMPSATIGKNVFVRFARLNNGKSPLNAQLLVFVQDANTLVTVEQVAAGPFVARGTFNYRATSFVAYSELYDVSAGRRQQGRPFGQLPGRAKAKARY